MAEDSTRRLMIELRRALRTALRAIDAYLVETSRRPERARQLYGPDGEDGYIDEIGSR